jgi:hypothetical protein
MHDQQYDSAHTGEGGCEEGRGGAWLLVRSVDVIGGVGGGVSRCVNCFCVWVVVWTGVMLVVWSEDHISKLFALFFVL